MITSNAPTTESRMIRIKLYLSYCWILKYALLLKNSPKILEPSNGGMGIKLNTIKHKFNVTNRTSKYEKLCIEFAKMPVFAYMI